MTTEREEADRVLARRVVSREVGAPAAEAELCRRFAPRIRLYGLKHLRSEERAKDLVQAVLLAVLEALRAGRVAELEHLDRFVLGTSRNVASRMRQTDARLEPVSDEALDVEAVLPELERLDLRRLVRCLSRLDERVRAVVWLAFHEEQPSAAIAEAVGTTAGNVRVLRHRALADLRACMEGGA